VRSLAATDIRKIWVLNQSLNHAFLRHKLPSLAVTSADAVEVSDSAFARGETSSFSHEGPKAIMEDGFVPVESTQYVSPIILPMLTADPSPGKRLNDCSMHAGFSTGVQQGITDARWAVHFSHLARVYRAEAVEDCDLVRR
jgi:hypothetical protein